MNRFSLFVVAVMLILQQVRGLVPRSLRTSAFRSGSALSSSRESAAGKSLDVALIATEGSLVASHLRARRSSDTLLQEVARVGELRAQRSAQIVEGDKAKGTRKTLSAQIGGLMKAGKAEEAAELKEQVAAAAAVAAACDEKLGVIDAQIADILSCVPNLIADDVPDGADESSNEEVRVWGAEKRKLGKEGDYLWHDDIATHLGGLQSEAAARISGARFSVLTGPVAKLERALLAFFLDFHSSRGYLEVATPLIVSRSTLEGTGQLPKFEDDLFKVSHSVAGEDAFLIPTAEVPVTSLHREQLLEKDALPLRYVCGSNCFRAEAGSYGRDTRGLLRQHQFLKAELVSVVAPEESEAAHQAMVADAEAVLEALELPYRTVLLCSGDMGFSARKCYDLEVWLPGQQAYREVASVSNCADFQARRMGLRVRTLAKGGDKSSKAKQGGKTTAYPHTLNGSGVAVGRALVAVLENNQQPDGSVLVPAVLQPYLRGLTVLEPVRK